MLQLQNINKQYKTGDLVQTALNDVSLNLRDNEFVAILGPSGSGKTTLLNVIGGLDRYDSGDLIINGVSTKKYKDKDWDSYRNHTIGFVFQSYNLIPHQTILSNVELALTISGISRSERKQRAIDALTQVGLGEQIHKKPNQMSGGQMQRVAIARALVNDPDIVLADEPTGALDTETSVQVMNLLKEVAKDRLVVMVTHNPELAEEYATRIVRLKDGKIIDDSDSLTVNNTELAEPEHKNLGKASMSFLTALSLSFNNLKTKKGRTFLTAFAGSIGIIGIALILSLSNGVNTYINDIQRSTMTSYPITIDSESFDMSSMMDINNQMMTGGVSTDESTHKKDAVYSNTSSLESSTSMITSLKENNLTDFKKYLDNSDSEINKYIGENGIVYSYDTKFDVFTYDSENTLVNTDGSTLEESDTSTTGGMSISSNNTSNNFEELIPSGNGETISTAVTDNYDVVYGTWPKNYNEVVIVLDENNEISATTLYQLGLLPTSEYQEIMKQAKDGEDITFSAASLSYEDICNQTFYLIPECDYYIENDNGYYDVIDSSSSKFTDLMDNALQLKITGIIRPQADSETTSISSAVGYTNALTNYIIDYTNDSSVVKAQEANPDSNILNGVSFNPFDDAQKIEDAKFYINSLGVSDKASLLQSLIVASATGSNLAESDAASYQSSMASAAMTSMSEDQMAAYLDTYLASNGDSAYLDVYDNYVSPGTYDDNLSEFGVVSLDAPSSIGIYADSFEDKDAISTCIEDYNTGKDEADQITYTDYVGLIMSSVTTIINVITYVLVAFVAVSLVVSSIMIGIITYISVLERTKEIGILRALGASKRNITQVFNAETFIIGLFSGLIGIGTTLLLQIPLNAIIHSVTNNNDVSAALPVASAVILIILSVILTLIGGFIPSKKAAKKDPVTALRTE